MGTTPRVSARRSGSDQTRAWQLFGHVAPERDLLWDEPERTLDGLHAAPLISVSWARLDPDYRVHDDEALSRYRKIVGMVVDRGWEPRIVLGEGWPWWMGEELWLTPGAPDRYRDHVRRVVEALGDACRHWVLHQLSPVDGWLTGSEPPGRFGALSDAWAVADNVMTGHVLAYETIHDISPEATVAMGTRPSTCYEWHRLALDLLWVRSLAVPREEVDQWLAGRRRSHDRCEPASSVIEWGARAGIAAASAYGRGAGRSPRRALDVLYAANHRLAVDEVRLDWSGRRQAWDRMPPDRARWLDDQRRLTPGIVLVD